MYSIPATIHKVISPNTYLINIMNSIRFVHKRQIRYWSLEDHLYPWTSNKLPQNETETFQKQSVEIGNNEVVKINKNIKKNIESIPLRWSERLNR